MDDPLLTFVIPVRHPQNARDWSRVKRTLSETLHSIAAQTDPRWRGVVVANRGSDLPDLPDRFSVAAVDHPPNDPAALASPDKEVGYNALRMDKGRRVLAGLVAARPPGFVMTVDEDDFVSRRLVAFVAQHQAANGWFLRDGYAWTEGGRLLYRVPNLSLLCGTSHIVRNDLLAIPADIAGAGREYIRTWLGSHRHIQHILAAQGSPLAPLPFAGAIYRVGQTQSVTGMPGVLRMFFDRSLLRRPREAVRRALRVRVMTPALRREFFGEAAARA